MSWPAPSVFGRTGASCAVQSCSRVAIHAVGYVPDEVFAARQARRRALELSRRERARPRPDKRPPSDGERDPHGQNDRQRDEHPHQNFPEFFHLLRISSLISKTAIWYPISPVRDVKRFFIGVPLAVWPFAPPRPESIPNSRPAERLPERCPRYPPASAFARGGDARSSWHEGSVALLSPPYRTQLRGGAQLCLVGHPS